MIHYGKKISFCIHIQYKSSSPHRSTGCKQFIHGIEELEGCRCYSWGENLLHVSDYGYGEYLVNISH